MKIRENCKYAVVVPTSMGVRICPMHGQPVASSDNFFMQATSAESNVLSIASYLGMTLALNWKFAIGMLIGVVVITVVTDYIVLATTTTVTVVPVYMGIVLHSLGAALILLTATATILWKHRDNYVRLANGTEIGLRAGVTKKNTDRQSKDRE